MYLYILRGVVLFEGRTKEGINIWRNGNMGNMRGCFV